MAKKLAVVTYTTKRKDFLDIMLDSYLVQSRKEARYALGAACCAWRNWLIAMTKNPSKSIESKLTIPGCGVITVGWTGYAGRYAPRFKLRFRPISTIQKQIRQHNYQAHREWQAAKSAAADAAKEEDNPDGIK